MISRSSRDTRSGNARRSRGFWSAGSFVPARIAALVALAAAAAGCETSSAEPAPSVPVPVRVSQPISRDIVEDVEFTGRTAAAETVDVRARVSGFIDKVDFVDGTEVRTGQTLFQIDVRPFQAALEQAQAQLDGANAQLKKAVAELARADSLIARKVITPQDYDQQVAAKAQAQASVEGSEASVKTAKLNVEFATVKAAISGQVGRALVTQGNLVNADTTQLTTIAAVDPIYVYFDPDERTLLRLKQLVREGKAKLGPGDKIRVFIGLSNETGFPHEGLLDFADNTVNPSTGTIQVRGVFQNPKPSAGQRTLFPGLFARVRVPIGDPRPTLLITDRAIGTEQDQKFVYVVGPDRKVVQRSVQVGRLVDGMRVIDEGLKPNNSRSAMRPARWFPWAPSPMCAIPAAR
jgi:RND family efflux transporter MFP subunit